MPTEFRLRLRPQRVVVAVPRAGVHEWELAVKILSNLWGGRHGQILSIDEADEPALNEHLRWLRRCRPEVVIAIGLGGLGKPEFDHVCQPCVFIAIPDTAEAYERLRSVNPADLIFYESRFDVLVNERLDIQRVSLWDVRAESTLALHARAAFGAPEDPPQHLASLGAIEDRLRDQSIFHLLGVHDRERSHAAFLRWLLDPRGSHGMGSAPLRRFLLLAAAKAEPGVMLDAVDIDGFDLDSVEVVTELVIEAKRRLDVVVLDDHERPLMVIEYKVGADEGEDQTKDYSAWARANALDLGGRRILPLLVFLCPDRDDDTEPESPFVHLAYEPYCEWLAGLQPSNERARQLVVEFGSCLSQREDVDAPELAELLGRLQASHAAEIAALKGAKRSDREPLDPVLRRHEVVFEKLGVLVKRRFSLGESPFVGLVKDEALQRLTPDLWVVGGNDCVIAPFKPSVEVGHRLLPGSRFRVALFVPRPRNGRARFALSVRLRTPAPGMTTEETRDLRARLAADLRARLADTPLAKHKAKQATVAAVRVPVDMSEGDTRQSSEHAAPAVWGAVDLFRQAEPRLVAWCDEALPGLLARQSPLR